MNFFIKEWSDNTATLMANTGQVLWTFPSVEDAWEAYKDRCHIPIEYHDDNTHVPLCSSFMISI